MPGLTVKGQPIGAQQIAVVQAALDAASALSAPLAAGQALMYAGMGESSLGADAGTAQNVWQANNPSQYGPSPNWGQMATAFLQGTQDFGNGFSPTMGAIRAANQNLPVWEIANGVEDNAAWGGPGGPHQDSYAGQWPGGQAQGIQEAVALVQAYGKGLGAGASANSSNPGLWMVGSTSNPDQDYWTTINQYAQSAQWYAFSDGETLIAADGIKLMSQQPRAIIDLNDPAVISVDATWDNTSFTYTTSHVKQGNVQRRAALAKTPSPTGVTISLICDIDKFRGGDTVYLTNFGPANGVWLVGQTQRSAFQPFSELTLVQGMQPLNALTGTSYTAAQAAAAATSTSGVAAQGFANPFPGGWTPGRADMGYDGTFKGQIAAPFAGTITYAGVFQGWNGSQGVIIKSAQNLGPSVPTNTLYFVEGVLPSVVSGQQVSAGQQIATAVASPYNGIVGNIEWGVSQAGIVGQQVDAYAIQLGTGTPQAQTMVLNFIAWATQQLGVANYNTSDPSNHPGAP